jgi:bifunctional non-homologous end joining protein LigD
VATVSKNALPALPFIAPMLLTACELPADDDRYLFEVKYDGFRVVAYVENGTVRLLSRRRNEIASAPVAELGGALKRRRAILDAELIAVDDEGRPVFHELQSRLTGGGAVALMLFDLLYLDGETLTKLPLEERKRRLGALKLNGPTFCTTTFAVGGGAALLAASREQRIEGIVAKRFGSVYRPGRRSADWIKIKNFERSDLIIGGWVTHRDGTWGILVGDLDGGEFVFGGVVDIGIGPKLIAVLETIERPRSPFARTPVPVPKAARFVEPRLVAEVQYLAGASSLRHAKLEGVRVRT